MKKEAIPRNQATLLPADPEMLRNAIQLMSDISPLVAASGGNSDFAIDEALAMVGRIFSASRVYVMLDEKDGRYLRNTHEWVDERIGPSMFSWPLYDYEYDLPSLKALLDDRDSLFAHTRDLPLDLQTVLSRQKVASVLLVPLLRDGFRIGLVGIDYCQGECEFGEAHLIVLRFLAAQVSLALERKQFQSMRSKLASIRALIVDVDPLLVGHKVEEPQEARPSKPVTLLDAERRIIIETLEQYNGNKLKTAKHLGLTWPSLDRRCKKLGIEVKRR